MTRLRPNVLLITSDQQHWSTLGFVNPELQTPNLDRLADSGTSFSRALGTKLPESVPSVGDAFTESGYRTALVGKAHFRQLIGIDEFPSLEFYPIMQDLDFWRDFHGPFYGFHHVELARNHEDEAHVGQHYALWMEVKGYAIWRDYFREPTGTSQAQRWKWNIPEEIHYNTESCSICTRTPRSSTIGGTIQRVPVSNQSYFSSSCTQRWRKSHC